jgi:hypothetical protein
MTGPFATPAARYAALLTALLAVAPQVAQARPLHENGHGNTGKYLRVCAGQHATDADDRHPEHRSTVPDG